MRVGLPEILEDADNGLPGLAREVFVDLDERLRGCDERISTYDRRIAELARASAPRAVRCATGASPSAATCIFAPYSFTERGR